MPVPQEAERQKKKIVRKQGKTAILTSSPYKAELEAAVAKKLLEEKIKKERKEKRDAKAKEQNGKENNGKQVGLGLKQKSKKLKRKLSYPLDDNENNNSEDNPKKSQPSTTKIPNSNKILDSKNKKKKTNEVSDSSSDEEEAEEACIFCNELYCHSKANEGWIQCRSCRGWAHEACSKCEEMDDDFECDLCSYF